MPGRGRTRLPSRNPQGKGTPGLPEEGRAGPDQRLSQVRPFDSRIRRAPKISLPSCRILTGDSHGDRLDLVPTRVYEWGRGLEGGERLKRSSWLSLGEAARLQGCSPRPWLVEPIAGRSPFIAAQAASGAFGAKNWRARPTRPGANPVAFDSGVDEAPIRRGPVRGRVSVAMPTQGRESPPARTGVENHCNPRTILARPSAGGSVPSDRPGSTVRAAPAEEGLTGRRG